MVSHIEYAPCTVPKFLCLSDIRDPFTVLGDPFTVLGFNQNFYDWHIWVYKISLLTIRCIDGSKQEFHYVYKRDVFQRLNSISMSIMRFSNIVNVIAALYILSDSSWASYQIRKIAGSACTGNAGNISPPGRCVTHVPWCMSGSLTRAGEENVPSIPGAYATHNFTYLARDPFGHCLRSVFEMGFISSVPSRNCSK